MKYREARQEGFTERNIRSGFRKAGIWPFNPSQVLDNPEALLGDSPPPPERPLTPNPFPIEELTAFTTPKKSQDILRALGSARGHVSPSQRNVRRLLVKSGKALDQANAERALLKAQLEAQQENNRALKPYSKKKVRENRNDKFVSIEAIAKAQEASERPPKRRKKAAVEDPTPAVQQAQEEIVHGLERYCEAQEM